MGKEFDVNDKIIFPNNLFVKNIHNYKVIIAPEYPNWLILNSQEYEIFNILSKKSIIDGLKEFYINHPDYNEDMCVNIFTNFLTKIEECQFYAESDSKEEDPIESIKKRIHITLTNDCNMRCPHCFVSAGIVEKRELNIQNIISKIEEIEKINGITEIVISGGEPLIHPDVFELLNKIKHHKVILFTNGTLINNENYNIIADCCQEVQISFEGLTKEVYEKIRGKGNYKKVINAIHLLKKTNIKISLAITILPSTLDDVYSNLINFVKMIDYDNLEIRLNNEIEITGNAVNIDFSNYNKVECDKKIMELIKLLKDMGIYKKSLNGRNIKFKNCGIGTNIVIDANGKIYPCNKFSIYYKDFSMSATKMFIEFNELNKKTSTNNISQCKSCELRYICAGGCRIDHLNDNGNMIDVNCNEEYKQKQYEKLLYDYFL